MKSIKKPLSLLLSLIMIIGMLTIVQTTAVSAVSDPSLAQETVQGGAVLHCFNWSYNNIKAKLADIAAAGYTAVQTSPVQRPKDYNASWTNLDGQWWKLYQPLGLSLADGNTWLGTKAELTALCAKAEEYGIKVIVDIVANHLANNGNEGGTYSYLNSGVESDLKNANYYHTNNVYTNDNSRYNITQYHMGQPDLNTGNSYIQNKVLSMLKDCVDCGVDGFRFDAAKHIETPDDGSNFKSDFWPVVIDGVKNYCENESKPEPFMYGEILGQAGPNFPISNYTEYYAVTDNTTGNNARDNVINNNISALGNSGYFEDTSADKCVLWAESHDTYMDGATNNVSNSDINRTWAVVGSRADSTSLFLARPNSTMGAASSDANWQSDVVTEVNKFKNLFDGQSEYISTDRKVYYNERGSKGAVIVVKDGGAVRLNANKMVDGTYKDHITGNNFTVSNGLISGNVDPDTGVAVLYNANDIEDTSSSGSDSDTLYLKPNTGSYSWHQGNERYAMYFFGAGEAWVSMTDSDNDGIYSGKIPSGGYTNVIFCRMNGNSTQNNWNNKWCQTNDLALNPTAYDLYTIDNNVTQDTNPATGQWSKMSAGGTTTYNHYFGDPTWSWGANFSYATATFACNDNCSGSPYTAQVQPVVAASGNGENHYTAKAKLNGVSHSVTAVSNISGRLYLKPNDNWKHNNERYAMYFYNGLNTSQNQWVSMSQTKSDEDCYVGEVPTGTWTNVIFCRMDGSNSTNNWNNVWNQTVDEAPLDGNCYTITNSPANSKATGTWGAYKDMDYYTTADGSEIKLNDTFERDSEDTVDFSISRTFSNLQILGVQTKSDNSEDHSIRFIAVMKKEILRDAEDYGFIAAASGSLSRVKENISDLTYEDAVSAGKYMYSCAETSNNVSGNYGDYSADTGYKYVTFTVNDIGDTNGVAVKFYVKDKNGNVHYADYLKGGETFNNCATDWETLAGLMQGGN
jgi:hypothetical protein